MLKGFDKQIYSDRITERFADSQAIDRKKNT